MSTPAMRAMVAPQPCRCLCLGLVQMTRPPRRRRMTLQCSHMGLTLGLTFMLPSLSIAVGDATSGEVVGRDLHLDTIAGQDPDAVHPHLPGGMGQDLMAIFQPNLEHGVGERFDDLSLHHDRVFLGFRQGGLRRWGGLAGRAPRERGRTTRRRATDHRTAWKSGTANAPSGARPMSRHPESTTNPLFGVFRMALPAGVAGPGAPACG